MSKNCVKRTMPCQCPSCRSEALRMGLSSEQCSFCKAELNVATNKDVWYQFIGDKIACEPCYKKNYKVCRICGRTHLVSEMAAEDINFRGESISVCKKCADTQFKVCGCCNKLSYKGDLQKYEQSWFCHDCFTARFEVCQVCHKTYPKDEVSNAIWNKTAICCNKCFLWHGPILRYEHTNYLKPLGKGPLYYGLELEVALEDKVKDHRGPVAQEVLKSFNDKYLVLKEDRSVMDVCGFEICTCPAELSFHKEAWGKFLAKLPANLIAFGSDKCGLHVHVSRAALSFLGVGKMLVFVNDETNRKFIECIAQRTANDYCKIYKKKMGDCMAQPTGRIEQHHEALNLQNNNTVELRIFKATLKPASFYKALEFTDALVHFCMAGNFSIKDCRSVENFVKYVEQNKKDWPHLWAYLCIKWLKATDENSKKWINKYGYSELNNEI